MEFRCELIDENNRRKKQVIEADNEQLLLLKVKQMNCYLVSKEEIEVYAQPRGSIKVKELIIFCRQMSVMLQSGVTLVRAVNIMQMKSSVGKTSRMYQDMYEALQKGNSLYGAMNSLNCFPELLLNMVKAGEASGTLDSNLSKMAEHFEKEHRLQNKIKGALTYPMILASMTVAIVLLLVTFVLPTFFNLYAGQELPLPTRIVVGVSNFITGNWISIIIFIVICVFTFPLLRKIPKIARLIDGFKLNAPMIGKLNRVIYSARCARTFSSLYSSGLDMIELLKMLGGILVNKVIEDGFEVVVEKVSRGELISTSLIEMNIFDPMFTSMVFIGEESGSMETILIKAADYFDEEAEAATTRLVGMLEPLLIIIMGLVVGFIVVAIMMPMYGMLQHVQ